MNALLLSLVVGAAALPKAELHLGTPESTADSFRHAVDAALAALERAKKQSYEQHFTVYIPGVRSKAQEVLLAEGPVERIGLRQLKRGVELRFATRGPAAEIARAVTIDSEPGAIRLGSPAAEVSVTAESHDPHASDPASRILARPAAPVASGPKQGLSGSLWIIGVFLLCVAVAAAALVRRQKGQQNPMIDVVAVRSLGAKHKLAVVEACGLRMLVATSDKDVRLLTHLDRKEQPGDAFASLLAAEQRPSTPAPTPAAAPTEPSADVSGLLRLRERAQAATQGPDPHGIGDLSLDRRGPPVDDLTIPETPALRLNHVPTVTA